ncbi:MAG: hypothetical protein ACTHLX_23585 [Candidatus Binatia bacterium]
MRKPEAVSRSKPVPRHKATAHAIDTKPKLLFVTPLVTFLTAALIKLVPVDWDIGWVGVALLVGFAVVGTCLQCIPRRSVRWPAEPGSSQAALKQTITTMRVLVSIVMVLVPVAVLATNDRVLSALPRSVENYLGGLNAERFAGGVVSVAVETERKRNVLLFVPVDKRQEESALLKFQPTAAAPILFPGGSEGSGSSRSRIDGVAGELYILQTAKVVDNLLKGAVMPAFHQFATLALVLSAVFIFVIFIMEILGDLLLSMQPKRMKMS